MNVVVLQGVLASAPETRTLGSGVELVSYEVTIREGGRATDQTPVVWFSAPASAAKFSAGTEVVVTGRVRRRFFRSGGATSSRTEVVAEAVIPARRRKRVAVAIAAVTAPVGEQGTGVGRAG